MAFVVAAGCGVGCVRGRSEAVETLVVEVETSFASGEFRVDERLRADEVRVTSDGEIGSARIAVRLDDSFDAFDARQRYHADLRLVVRTDEVDPARRLMLFEGHPPRQSAGWDGRPGRDRETYAFTAEHVYGRLRRARASQVFGRRVRNGPIEDGLQSDPAAFAGQSVLIAALPCVFNAGGVANRAALPLTVTAPDGSSRAVHVFTYDGDPAAEAWTFATALRYLAWFYCPRPGPVLEGNVFAVTDALAVGGENEGVGVKALSRSLSSIPTELNGEGLDVVAALAALARAAGIHVSAETLNVGGRAQTALRVWSSDDGVVKRVRLARGGRDASGVARYDTAGRRVEEILRDNDTFAASIEWDDRRMANTVIALGDVKRYEVTLPLVPGWAPEANLDNVSVESRGAAKALALTPDQVSTLGSLAETNAWYRRYHRQGSEYHAGMQVARRWVLNEHGRYDAATYNRNAPFDAYGPFDFSTVIGVTSAGAWMRRARRLLPPITRTEAGQSLPTWVEISFDSGASWQRLTRSVVVSRDEIGVFLNVANPTEITPVGVDPEVQNLWYALVDQTFRVRVTGAVESDERVMHETEPGQVDSPTLEVRGVVVRDARAFRFATRQGTTDVLASVNAESTAIERDDGEAIRAYAERLADSRQDREVRATPAIPWIDRAYAVGDRIAGVRGRELSFAATRDPAERHPTVIGKRYRFATSGERGYVTELVLERGGR